MVQFAPRPIVKKTLVIVRTHEFNIWRRTMRSPLLLLLAPGWAMFGFLTVRGSSKPAEVIEPSVDRSIYGHVVQVGFVVKNLDRTVKLWEEIGFRNIRRMGDQEIPAVTYLGKKSPVTLKMAQGEVGGVQILWIEPVKGASDFDKFLKAHGEGIHHLLYRAKSMEELDRQVEHFKSKGVGVAMEIYWSAEQAGRRSVYLETAERGAGITFGLVYDPAMPESNAASTSQNEEPFNKFAQYAIVARDLKKSQEFYESLRFGNLPMDHVDYSSVPERYYRGKPGKFTIYTNQWRWGTVPYEWIQPGVGPSVFEDYLKNHGEGIQHVAFTVPDMDKTLAAMAAKGVKEAQSGGFNYQGRRGRFAYVDMEPYGGVMIEFIWREAKKE